MVESERIDYEEQTRQKLALEYAKKREELLAAKSAPTKPTFSGMFSQYQIDLSGRYPEGVTEESEILPNREIKRIIVNRGGGNANLYSRVQWNWGGVYYFKNEQSTSKLIFDTESKW
jgi:hypothetical protein